MDGFVLPWNLQEFKPHVAIERSMDQLTLLTKDTTTVTHWLGRFHLELLQAGYSRQLVGFHLVSIHGLAGTQELNSVPHLLCRAWKRDWASGNWRERIRLSYGYIRALYLMWQYPQLRVV